MVCQLVNKLLNKKSKMNNKIIEKQAELEKGILELKEMIKNSNKTNEINSYEDILKNINPDKEVLNIINYEGSNKHFLKTKHYTKLALLVEAYNPNWKPDYKNKSQGKYYPYFKYENDGFVFFCVNFDYCVSCVGSSLSFETENKVREAVTKFPEIFTNFLENQ